MQKNISSVTRNGRRSIAHSIGSARRFNVTWSTATPEVRAFVEEATRVAYEQKKAQATIRLMSEIAKGRRSGEEKGCLTNEEMRAHFRARANEEPLEENPLPEE